MDQHFKDYFHEYSDDFPSGNFHRVIALHDAPDMDWESASTIMPSLKRAWYELSQLDKEDRLEFTRSFWESQLPFRPYLSEFLDAFFDSMDDIGIFLTQKKYEDPFIAHMVYSLSENRGFFRGGPPATEDEIAILQENFANVILPEDFLSFLRIHNGFYKTTDCTGIYNTSNMFDNYAEFQELFGIGETLKTKNDVVVDPKKLYPFYKSFGLPYYQCFWAEWYPEDEMGVVYFSGKSKTVSDISDEGTTPEHLAFPTFTDWLMFYLEPVEI